MRRETSLLSDREGQTRGDDAGGEVSDGGHLRPQNTIVDRAKIAVSRILDGNRSGAEDIGVVESRTSVDHSGGQKVVAALAGSTGGGCGQKIIDDASSGGRRSARGCSAQRSDGTGIANGGISGEVSGFSAGEGA